MSSTVEREKEVILRGIYDLIVTWTHRIDEQVAKDGEVK